MALAEDPFAYRDIFVRHRDQGVPVRLVTRLSFLPSTVCTAHSGPPVFAIRLPIHVPNPVMAMLVCSNA